MQNASLPPTQFPVTSFPASLSQAVTHEPFASGDNSHPAGSREAELSTNISGNTDSLNSTKKSKEQPHIEPSHACHGHRAPKVWGRGDGEIIRAGSYLETRRLTNPCPGLALTSRACSWEMRPTETPFAKNFKHDLYLVAIVGNY